MTTRSSSVNEPASIADHNTIPYHASAKRLSWHGKAVANGDFDSARIGGVVAWLGAEA